MFKKYAALTLTLLAGQQASSMTYLRRLSPAVAGATAVFSKKMTDCKERSHNDYMHDSSVWDKDIASARAGARELRDLMKRCKAEPGKTYQESCDPLFDQYKAAVNMPNYKYETPIFEANTADSALALIRMGADVNYGSNTIGKLQTPLHKCLHPQVVRVLLEAGAKVDVLNKYGETPLFNAILDAANKTDCVRVSEDLSYGRSALLSYEACGIGKVAELLHDRANPNYKNDHGKTPLHLLAKKSYANPTITNMLLMHGANPYIKDQKGRSSVDVAAKQNNTDFIHAVGTYKKCSKWRLWERDVTGLNDEQVIDQVLNGKRGSCTR